MVRRGGPAVFLTQREHDAEGSGAAGNSWLFVRCTRAACVDHVSFCQSRESKGLECENPARCGVAGYREFYVGRRSIAISNIARGRPHEAGHSRSGFFQGRFACRRCRPEMFSKAVQGLSGPVSGGADPLEPAPLDPLRAPCLQAFTPTAVFNCSTTRSTSARSMAGKSGRDKVFA